MVTIVRNRAAAIQAKHNQNRAINHVQLETNSVPSVVESRVTAEVDRARIEMMAREAAEKCS